MWEEEHVGRALALPGNERKNKAPGNLRLTRDARTAGLEAYLILSGVS